MWSGYCYFNYRLNFDTIVKIFLREFVSVQEAFGIEEPWNSESLDLKRWYKAISVWWYMCTCGRFQSSKMIGSFDVCGRTVIILVAWAWSTVSRSSWSWRTSLRRSIFVSRVRSRSVSMTRVTSLRWSIRRYLWRASWSGVYFINIISWSCVFWRSSVSVIVITVSRCVAKTALWSVVFVSKFIVSCTSISTSIVISICSIIERITKVLYKRHSRRLCCSIGFSFIFVVSLFLETYWDRVICSVTIGTKFFRWRFS